MAESWSAQADYNQEMAVAKKTQHQNNRAAFKSQWET